VFFFFFLEGNIDIRIVVVHEMKGIIRIVVVHDCPTIYDT